MSNIPDTRLLAEMELELCKIRPGETYRCLKFWSEYLKSGQRIMRSSAGASIASGLMVLIWVCLALYAATEAAWVLLVVSTVLILFSATLCGSDWRDMRAYQAEVRLRRQTLDELQALLEKEKP